MQVNFSEGGPGSNSTGSEVASMSSQLPDTPNSMVASPIEAWGTFIQMYFFPCWRKWEIIMLNSKTKVFNDPVNENWIEKWMLHEMHEVCFNDKVIW